MTLYNSPLQRQIGVVAGPRGFYGRTARTLVLGKCRQNRDEALDDADRAQELLDQHNFLAAHAWREVN